MLPSTAIVRYDLSQPFSEFDTAANRKGFIGPQVLRPRLVSVQAADVGKVKLKQLLQQRSNKRAAGAGYKRSQAEFEKYAYSTEEFGHEVPIDDRQLRIFRDIIDAETVHTERACNVVLDEYERDVAAAIYNTTTWTGAGLTTALTNEWDDATNATPIQDIIAGREKVIAGSGLDPNALIMNSFQYHHLLNTNQIVERVKYTARADQETLRTAVADVIGVKHIIVAGGLTNTANPQQTAAISRIWSNEYMMLARVAETDDPQEACVGRTFMWSEDGPGAAGSEEELAIIVEEYREEGVRGSVIRARNDRDIVVMYAAAAHLFSNAIT